MSKKLSDKDLETIVRGNVDLIEEDYGTDEQMFQNIKEHFAKEKQEKKGLKSLSPKMKLLWISSIATALLIGILIPVLIHFLPQSNTYDNMEEYGYSTVTLTELEQSVSEDLSIPTLNNYTLSEIRLYKNKNNVIGYELLYLNNNEESILYKVIIDTKYSSILDVQLIINVQINEINQINVTQKIDTISNKLLSRFEYDDKIHYIVIIPSSDTLFLEIFNEIV